MREICARYRREERKRREKCRKERGWEEKYSQWRTEGQTDRKKRGGDIVYRKQRV